MAQTIAMPAAGTRLALAALPPLALYVHFPWCVRKCPYCDFNSHEWRAGGELPEREYLDALVADLESVLPDVWGRRVHTIFFGGGTPSLMSARGFESLLDAIRARLPIAPDAEITLEANPGTFEAGRFRDYRAAGANRLSIGVQSFEPRHLAALGRVHGADEAQRAIEIAAREFETFNIDFMYALPGQSLEEAERDVAAALASGAPHLSAYHLTIEPNTYFHRYPPALPDDDEAAAIHDLVAQRIEAAGFTHYETSAYARAGNASRHNLNYWTFGDYIGIGAGAHAKLSFPDRIRRDARCKQPREYMQRVALGSQIQETRLLHRDELPFEFMMNALRLSGGFAIETFTARTGLPISSAERGLVAALERGLIERDPLRIRPTDRGRAFLNDLLQLFLPDPGTARAGRA